MLFLNVIHFIQQLLVNFHKLEFEKKKTAQIDAKYSFRFNLIFCFFNFIKNLFVCVYVYVVDNYMLS